MALRASSSVWVYLRSPSRCSWMSPPAEKARSPAPVMTMQPTSSSALIRVTASRSSVPSWAFIALSCSGRFMVTIATPCVFSTRMESAILSLPRVAHERQCGVAYTAGGVSVLTRIDHVMLCVPNLEEGIGAYTRRGFHVYPGGAHSGGATHNAIAFHQEDYLELLTPRGGRPAGALIPGSSDARLTEFLARGGGFRYVAVQSDDLGADVAAMRGRGVVVGDATEGSRPARARPLSGALPHEQYGRRGPLDGESRHAAAGARHPQYRRAGDPGRAGSGLWRLYRFRRPGVESSTRGSLLSQGGSHGLRIVHDAVASTRAQSVRRPPVGPAAASLGGRARLQRGVDRRASHRALGAAPVAGPAGGPGADADQPHAHRPGRISDAVPPPRRACQPGGDARPHGAGAAQFWRGGERAT